MNKGVLVLCLLLVVLTACSATVEETNEEPVMEPVEESVETVPVENQDFIDDEFIEETDTVDIGSLI